MIPVTVSDHDIGVAYILAWTIGGILASMAIAVALVSAWDWVMRWRNGRDRDTADNDSNEEDDRDGER